MAGPLIVGPDQPAIGFHARNRDEEKEFTIKFR